MRKFPAVLRPPRLLRFLINSSWSTVEIEDKCSSLEALISELANKQRMLDKKDNDLRSRKKEILDMKTKKRQLEQRIATKYDSLKQLEQEDINLEDAEQQANGKIKDINVQKKKIVRELTELIKHGNQGKHRVTKRGPALSYPKFTLVAGIVGRWRAVCVTALQRPNSDAAAIRIVKCMLLNKEKVEFALENTTILLKKNKVEYEYKEAAARLKELEEASTLKRCTVLVLCSDVIAPTALRRQIQRAKYTHSLQFTAADEKKRNMLENCKGLLRKARQICNLGQNEDFPEDFHTLPSVPSRRLSALTDQAEGGAHTICVIDLNSQCKRTQRQSGARRVERGQ
ncbi:unnamed protein product, partial [Ranitomeya imitator]